MRIFPLGFKTRAIGHSNDISITLRMGKVKSDRLTFFEFGDGIRPEIGYDSNHMFRMGAILKTVVIPGLLLGLVGCSNNPYRPGETEGATLFWAMESEPTQLDPVTSYYSHESDVIDQIYEPPFGYHYLKRPYELVPYTATEIPKPVYFDKAGKRIEEEDPAAEIVGRVEYTIRLRKDIRYQNHPCFAKKADGSPYWREVKPEDIADYEYPTDFPEQGTRKVTAHDYALQIRRLADSRLVCPVFANFDSYILGLSDLQKTYEGMLEEERARRKEAQGASYNPGRDEKENPIALDFMAASFGGVEVLDDYTYKLVLKRKFPQILYWMCMHFFAPVPREALDFYNQPAMIARQFNINRCPVGSGPYYISVYRPNELIVFEKNPNYHDDFYPSEGAPGDREAGLLVDAGKKLPFIDRQVFVMEKEAIPRWNKFLQGYYDISAISSDVFDQAINVSAASADVEVSDRMQEQGIELQTSVKTQFWYMMFNMKDDVIGGYDEKTCKLRQAISIVLDYEEYVNIFYNGRGIEASGPLPPGIFGNRVGKVGMNPYTFEWDEARGKIESKSLDEAKRLLAEAGYPGGRTADGQRLTLNYDFVIRSPTDRSYFEWIKRKFDLLGIRLKDQVTDLSRLREKFDGGNWQISTSGWLADYPDPENFLFLFYGPNGKVEHRGSNTINYDQAEYNRVFEKLETMENGPARQKLIDEAVAILQHDAPAVWQFFPVSYALLHKWYTNYKPHEMTNNDTRFHRMDGETRAALQAEWNTPRFLPVLLVLGGLLLAFVPGAMAVYRRERQGEGGV